MSTVTETKHQAYLDAVTCRHLKQHQAYRLACLYSTLERLTPEQIRQRVAAILDSKAPERTT